VSGISPDRPAVNGRGSWKSWLRLILALGWILLATRPSFQRRAPKPPRRPDEPAIWKLVVWMILFVTLFYATWILPALLKGG
jgi:hypothetical protein